MKNKSLKLYNLIFPIWAVFTFIPITWLIILPANYIIDSLVVLLTLKILKIKNIKENYKKTINLVWIFGFVSDIIGSFHMVLTFGAKLPTIIDKNTEYIQYNAFGSLFSFLYVTICVLIASFLIFIFNYKISLKSVNFTKKQKFILSLSLAIFTAPYLLYLPSSFLFG